MAKGDDIEERLIDFAVRVINLCGHLPDTAAARHVSGQLLRSGTAPAPHYSEARGAESSRDFIHKLGICLKELNELRVWLEDHRQKPDATRSQHAKHPRRMRRTLPDHQLKHQNSQKQPTLTPLRH